MYSSKLSISKRFSMSVTWYILYILPRSVNFHNIVKEPGRASFPGTFELSAFICELLIFMRHTLTNKTSSRKFRLLRSWNLLPRFLRLYITEFFCLQHLNLTITLSVLFSRWQACKSFGTTFTPVNDKALQMFSSKTSSVISAGTGFNSIVSLYWEFVTALCSSYIILVGKWELNFWHCCNSQLTLSYFDKKSLNFSARLLSIVLMSLMKLELISVSSWMTSS